MISNLCKIIIHLFKNMHIKKLQEIDHPALVSIPYNLDNFYGIIIKVFEKFIYSELCKSKVFPCTAYSVYF